MGILNEVPKLRKGMPERMTSMPSSLGCWWIILWNNISNTELWENSEGLYLSRCILIQISCYTE